MNIFVVKGVKSALRASLERHVLKEILFTSYPPAKVVRFLATENDNDENSNQIHGVGIHPESPCFDRCDSKSCMEISVRQEATPKSVIEGEPPSKKRKISGGFRSDYNKGKAD